MSVFRRNLKGCSTEYEACKFLEQYYGDFMRGFEDHPDYRYYYRFTSPTKSFTQEFPTVTTSNNMARYDVTRKLPVVCDAFYLQEDPTMSKKRYSLRYISLDEDDSGSSYYTYEYFIECEDVIALCKWLQEASGFIKSFRLFYIPHLTERFSSEISVISSHPVFALDDAKMRFKVYPEIPAYIDNRKYLPLFRLELPYIEDIDLMTLNKVFDDYPEELGAFRIYLERALNELELAVGSENTASAIERIQTEIDDGARLADLQYRKITRVSALRVASAILATWSFAIYAFFFQPPDMIKILGPGGGLSLVAKEVANYLQHRYELKENSFCFLSVVKRSSKR